MPGLNTPPRSIFTQIQENLRDRYSSGFPILKELIQNAEDAKAKSIRLVALRGWERALNPLLQGPGLLVVNDGLFKESDGEGILSFAASSKGDQTDAIGRFGFGQKAVFHLCDAFVAHAIGHATIFTQVVNPCKGLLASSKAELWDSIESRDVSLLESVVPDIATGFLLWIPLRRNEILPAPKLSFTEARPLATDLMDEFLEHEADLRLMLSALRHLNSIELLDQDTLKLSMARTAGSSQMQGPTESGGAVNAEFRGKIVGSQGHTSAYVGREAFLESRAISELTSSATWPREPIFTEEGQDARPKKASAQGAVVLAGWDPPIGTSDSSATLEWGVFLPMTKAEGLSTHSKCVRLLLHGYFFVDSGRRSIDGFSTQGEGEGLQARWNKTLRDEVVLPLVPPVMLDALNEEILDYDDLTTMLTGLLQSDFGRLHAAALTSRNSLARVFNATGERPTANWTLVPKGAKFRPMLSPDQHGRSAVEDDLFPGVGEWAELRGLTLVCGPDAALLETPALWQAEELADLIGMIRPELLLSSSRTTSLAEFLELALVDRKLPREAAHRLLGILKAALALETRLASDESLSSLLSFLPQRSAIGLPAAARDRFVLQALATATSDHVCVREEWLPPESLISELSEEGAARLISALQPLMEKDSQADSAGAAALALVKLALVLSTDAARSPLLSNLRCLRVSKAGGESELTSLGELATASREGRLFSVTPRVQQVVSLLNKAAPGSNALIVRGVIPRMLEEMGESFRPTDPTNEAFASLVQRTPSFGPSADRANLLSEIFTTYPEAVPGLRALATGAVGASSQRATLIALRNAQTRLDKLALQLLGASEVEFLVDAVVTSNLTRHQRETLGITDWDDVALGKLLANNAERLASVELDEDTVSDLLRSGVPAPDLRKLPIFLDQTGERRRASEIWRENADWPIPQGMALLVRLWRPPVAVEALDRIRDLIAPWTPDAQLDLALRATGAHRFEEEILAAAATSTGSLASRHDIRNVKWLTDVDGNHWSPLEVLTLPTDVQGAALDCLGSGTPKFAPLAEVKPSLREHPGFKKLQVIGVLPDSGNSVERLLELLGDERPLGFIGAANGGLPAALKSLARTDVSSKLPGTRFLLSLLRHWEHDPGVILARFGGIGPSHIEEAQGYMTELAEYADADFPGAWTAYRTGFQAICQWPQPARQLVLGSIPVRTIAGSFKLGVGVTGHGYGIAPSHMLDTDLSQYLPPSTVAEHAGEPIQEASHVHRTHISPSPEHLTHEVIEGLRPVLEYAAPHVPQSLLSLLVGLMGRSEPYERLAVDELRELGEEELHRVWRQLSERVESLVRPGGGSTVDQRRERNYVILVPVAHGPGEIEVEGLSGALIPVPTKDIESLDVLGDIHNSGFNYQTRAGHIRRIALQIAVPDNRSNVTDQVRALCKILAEVIFGYPSDQQGCFEELEILIDECSRPEQTTVERVLEEIRDGLPRILEELTLEPGGPLADARYEYKRVLESLLPGEADRGHRQEAKDRLWQSVGSPEAHAELLAAVRKRLSNYGYDEKRILFELFQNADDAYAQDPGQDEARFRLQRSADGAGLLVLHWGRLINHPGTSRDDTERINRRQDLFNMLQMNMSTKREEVTGRFGLGFKSVHLISQDVGVASRFVACRIHGGMLPEPWEEGRRLSHEHRSDSRAATVIELTTDPDREARMRIAGETFLAAAKWLTAVSRKIRTIEVEGTGTWHADFVPTTESDIQVVSFTGSRQHHALALRLTPETTVFISLDGDGPIPIDETVGRVWQLAPLEERVASGWIINSWSFRVDPGRGQLAGTIEDQRKLFEDLGELLGERLVELHDLVVDDWSGLADATSLVDSNLDSGRHTFLVRLIDLFSVDLEDALTQSMHGSSRGLGKLISERSALPTSLPQPFAPFVSVHSAKHALSGSLADRSVQDVIQDWPTIKAVSGDCVGERAADLLVRIGFKRPPNLNLVELMRREIGSDLRVDADLADRLGTLISGERFSRFSSNEQHGIHELLRQTRFLMEDGTWRAAALPPRVVADTPKAELARILAFAPKAVVASPDYQGMALDLYNLAGQQSGFQRTAREYAAWAATLVDPRAQSSVLRYVVDGDQGIQLAGELRVRHVAWVPSASAELRESPLLTGWTWSDTAVLLSRLYPAESEARWQAHAHEDNRMLQAQREFPSDLRTELEELHAWWQANAEEERQQYDQSAYPESFLWRRLKQETSEDRETWFTFFALGAFRTIGRTKDGSHRRFIDQAQQAGWWSEMAQADLPSEPTPWFDRLEDFAGTAAWRIDWPQWRRALADLYVVARWLPEYVDVFRSLPALVREHRQFSLADAWRPSASPIWQRRGLEGAPLTQSLGLGANWMIREAIRHGFWSPDEALGLHPYAWSATRRVRELFARTVGQQFDPKLPPMDHSPSVYHLVQENLGDGADFLGDLDLPLQLRASELE